jgi:hypothetical protein
LYCFVEGKTKLLEDQLELKVIELRDSNEELEELRRLNDEKSSCKLDLEKVPYLPTTCSLIISFVVGGAV